MSSTQLHFGDCLDVLRSMDSACVDAIVTDPPYGWNFMGRKWDYDVPSKEIWEQCLRVLKPGGHLLAFAGTRTQHRMCVNIEDAGFEIRDMIAWVYGSGFPKSMDVSKAIDKAGGSNPEVQSRLLARRRLDAGLTHKQVAEYVGCTASSVRDWEEGRARSKGSPLEFIIPSPAYRLKLADLLGYTQDERIAIGVAVDRRSDGTTYGLGHSGQIMQGGNTEAGGKWQGWGTALKPALEPITVARKPLSGTVAANVLEHGTGAINIDGCRIETDEKLARPFNDANNEVLGKFNRFGNPNEPNGGRWPANLIHDGSDEVTELFPETAPSKAGLRRNNSGMGIHDSEKGTFGKGDVFGGFNDSGSAARFFYCAKANKKDREEGNTHPTVKPTDLMAYLCRLVTPPGGVVLDPFMGSGSTGKAAIREGFGFIGIERDEEYFEIASSRIAIPAQAQLSLIA